MQQWVLNNLYLPQNNLVNFISNQNYTYQVTFFGAILLGIFIFKNLFLFAINYFQAVFFREIKIKNSERLFTNYLYSPYSFHLDRNPATVVRDIFGEVQNSCRFLDLLMINTVGEPLIETLGSSWSFSFILYLRRYIIATRNDNIPI